MELELNEEKAGAWTILNVRGRLNTTNYNLLEKHLSDLVQRHETLVLLDLKDMEYISSSGLRIFLMGLKNFKRMNGRFVLAGLQPSIAEIFRISGFVSIFDIYAGREEALKTD